MAIGSLMCQGRWTSTIDVNKIPAMLTANRQLFGRVMTMLPSENSTTKGVETYFKEVKRNQMAYVQLPYQHTHVICRKQETYKTIF